MVIPHYFITFHQMWLQVHCQSYWPIHPQTRRIQTDSTSPRASMMEVRAAETRLHARSRTRTLHTVQVRSSGPTHCTYKARSMQQKKPTNGPRWAAAGGRGRAGLARCCCCQHRHAAAVMPMQKSSTSSDGSDGGGGRRQRDHLGELLAEQVVVDELARGSNPGRAPLVCIMQIESSSGCTPWLLSM